MSMLRSLNMHGCFILRQRLPLDVGAKIANEFPCLRMVELSISDQGDESFVLTGPELTIPHPSYMPPVFIVEITKSFVAFDADARIASIDELDAGGLKGGADGG